MIGLTSRIVVRPQGLRHGVAGHRGPEPPPFPGGGGTEDRFAVTSVLSSQGRFRRAGVGKHGDNEEISTCHATKRSSKDDRVASPSGRTTQQRRCYCGKRRASSVNRNNDAWKFYRDVRVQPPRDAPTGNCMLIQ